VNDSTETHGSTLVSTATRNVSSVPVEPSDAEVSGYTHWFVRCGVPHVDGGTAVVTMGPAPVVRWVDGVPGRVDRLASAEAVGTGGAEAIGSVGVLVATATEGTASVPMGPPAFAVVTT
jgi:hypothetical protein